ncbi:ATP-grasp domain-containing protein [Priestia filamentosa]|uniref:ATP-grasp domain-containing protein n=1 Tax=Priestia filamentosa TaxID=1402861 RepID=UPI003981D754
MLHILLINSDKPEPIEFFQNYKKKHPNTQLTVLTRSCYASLYQDWADRVYEVGNLTDLSQIRILMLDILKHGSVDHIVTTTEKSVLTGGFLRSFYGISGPSFETTLWMTNKVAMKTRLRNEGIPVTDFMRLDNIEDIQNIGERLGWPLVIKPAIGSGAVNTFYIESLQHYDSLNSSNELNSLKKRDAFILAEKYVEMEEYHCDALYHNGKLLFISISKYTVPLLKGISKIQGSYILEESDPIYAQIFELNKSVIHALRVKDGPIHLEIYRTTSGDLLVGEIALRVGGGGISHMIEKKYNISMWDYSCQIALNQEPQIQLNPLEGIVGYLSLPCRNGTIKEFTSIEELEKLPHILEIELIYKPGDYVQEKQSSSFDLARIYFCVEKKEQLDELLSLVHQKFYLYLEEDFIPSK